MFPHFLVPAKDVCLGDRDFSLEEFCIELKCNPHITLFMECIVYSILSARHRKRAPEHEAFVATVSRV